MNGAGAPLPVRVREADKSADRSLRLTPADGQAMDRLEEALQVCRAMFTEESPTFQGRYYRIEGALNYPRPVQPGGPPILVAGSGERRSLRLVAQYADMCNLLYGDLHTTRHKLGVLEKHCAAVGRDPREIIKTRHSIVMLAQNRSEVEIQLAGMMERMAKANPGFDPEAARLDRRRRGLRGRAGGGLPGRWPGWTYRHSPRCARPGAGDSGW
jgi:alkanesulfonate monooxygenase SsuD/methylene tetrahydromethanopterin reductase-like flavin-dependent oxidoreductase (luciferase family)